MTSHVVHKYALTKLGVNVIATHRNARLIHAAEKDGHLCVWALVMPDEPAARRRVLVIGTGTEIDGMGEADYQPVATVMAQDGHVWHVFDLEALPPGGRGW